MIQLSKAKRQREWPRVAVGVLQDPHIYRTSLHRELGLFQSVSLSWPSLSLLPSSDFLCVPSRLAVRRPSVRLSPWLWGFIFIFYFFASLSYVTPLRGRGHFNQYFKHNLPPPPLGVAPNATWRHDRMTFEDGGLGRPWSTLCFQRHSGLWQWWLLGKKDSQNTDEREIRSHGESRKKGRRRRRRIFLVFFYLFVFLVVERRKNNGQMKTQWLGGQEPWVIHASRWDKSQTPKWKWNYS